MARKSVRFLQFWIQASTLVTSDRENQRRAKAKIRIRIRSTVVQVQVEHTSISTIVPIASTVRETLTKMTNSLRTLISG
ncbi:hypothetical protein WMZ97_13310 [Lentibacillus sp. N15]